MKAVEKEPEPRVPLGRRDEIDGEPGLAFLTGLDPLRRALAHLTSRGFPSPSCSCGIEMRCVSLTSPRGRRNAAFQETPRPAKHLMEHGARELPREGVLLARVGTSQGGHPRLQTVLRGGGKAGARPPP